MSLLMFDTVNDGFTSFTSNNQLSNNTNGSYSGAFIASPWSRQHDSASTFFNMTTSQYGYHADRDKHISTPHTAFHRSVTHDGVSMWHLPSSVSSQAQSVPRKLNRVNSDTFLEKSPKSTSGLLGSARCTACSNPIEPNSYYLNDPLERQLFHVKCYESVFDLDSYGYGRIYPSQSPDRLDDNARNLLLSWKAQRRREGLIDAAGPDAGFASSHRADGGMSSSFTTSPVRSLWGETPNDVMDTDELPPRRKRSSLMIEENADSSPPTSFSARGHVRQSSVGKRLRMGSAKSHGRGAEFHHQQRPASLARSISSPEDSLIMQPLSTPPTSYDTPRIFSSPTGFDRVTRSESAWLNRPVSHSKTGGRQDHSASPPSTTELPYALSDLIQLLS